ncbi:hypothetical protein [Rhizobium sp. 21-4511-3d]
MSYRAKCVIAAAVVSLMIWAMLYVGGVWLFADGVDGDFTAGTR